MNFKAYEYNKDFAKKYISETFDQITLRVPKGKKVVYKEVAQENGESLNQFIVDAIEEKIAAINE